MGDGPLWTAELTGLLGGVGRRLAFLRPLETGMGEIVASRPRGAENAQAPGTTGGARGWTISDRPHAVHTAAGLAGLHFFYAWPGEILLDQGGVIS